MTFGKTGYRFFGLVLQNIANRMGEIQIMS